MDPMLVEKDQDAVIAFFRAQPLLLNSTRHSVSIKSWLHDMKQILQIRHIEDHLQVSLADRCFIGDARLG